MTAVVPSLADRLAAAQLALHRLQIGQSAVEVTIESGRVTKFTPANIDKLQAYVDQLTAQASGKPANSRGAVGIVF